MVMAVMLFLLQQGGDNSMSLTMQVFGYVFEVRLVV